MAHRFEYDRKGDRARGPRPASRPLIRPSATFSPAGRRTNQSPSPQRGEGRGEGRDGLGLRLVPEHSRWLRLPSVSISYRFPERSCTNDDGTQNHSLRQRTAPLGNAGLVLGIGALGLVMAHHPSLFSGFRRIQTDVGDTRLIHYLLEHGYLWVRGIPEHHAFWNLPIFYPVPNTAAYSDLLLSVGPVYWLWRAGGASPDRAFAGWMISMSALNYASAIALFRKGLGFAWLPSAAAAFLVAFGAPRVNQMSHQQLLPCFFVLMTVFALARLFGGNPLRLRERGGLWLLAVLGGVLQFYCGFYLAWFLMLGIGFAVAAALLLPHCRPVFLEVVERDLWVIVTAALVGVLLLVPLLNHYLPVSRYVISRQPFSIYYVLDPYPCSWFHVGGNHWLWGWTAGREPFRTLGYAPEHMLGFGYITPLACAAGLFCCRERPICRLAAVVTLSMWLGITLLPGETIALVAFAVACYCLACLFLRGPRNSRGAAWTGGAAGDPGAGPVPEHRSAILAYSAILLCCLELVRMRGRPECQVLPGIALASCASRCYLWMCS